MTKPGSTTTTNYGADGNVTTTSVADASPETQAQTVTGAVTGTGGGAIGAVLATANFVYSIIKDHGAKLAVAVEAGGDGVASGTFDDAKFTSEIAGEFSAAGIWYTHTRAFGSLLAKHRGTMPHERIQDSTEFGSAYLCTTFPYELRWNLYKVTPKPIGDNEARKKRLEFTESEGAAYDTFNQQLNKLNLANGSLTIRVNRRDVDFRLQETDEDFDHYLKFIVQFEKKEPRLRLAVDQLNENLRLIRKSRDEYRDTVAKSKKTDEPFYVMRNITVQALTEHKGVRQRFWQHLAINSKFTITPRKEKPYGFRVGLVWGETALGYGYPGVAGDFEVTQTGPTVGEIEIGGGSKLGRRFRQFTEVRKDR